MNKTIEKQLHEIKLALWALDMGYMSPDEVHEIQKVVEKYLSDTLAVLNDLVGKKS